MTGHEKIAARNIKAAFNYEIGGLYNSYLDGEEINLTLEDAKDVVYDCAMTDRYGAGAVFYGAAPKEMRFAGKDFCIEYINKLFANDADVAEIPWKEAD